uniref:Uncharacterized protein n=1 Tax=Siphoviridae sp. ctoiW10 TaxID=2827592 RepID=A0A8S5LP60_9CAUD|nr:MAG TPA: hypothetical protein [Siphoviridae sp. ctoiW10]
MRDTNLVNALRCASTAGGPMGDCEKFTFYKTEPVPEELVEKVNLKEWLSCEVDPMVLAAADRIEACLKCGKYTQAHKGACNGCRWREMHHEA